MATVMIIGSGVVGQATGKALIKKGHKVLFVDTNIEVIRTMSQEGFEARLAHKLEDVTADFSMFCVSTNSRSDGSVDLNNIAIAAANHGRWLRCKKDDVWHLVVIRSTVPPGTTRPILLQLLEKYSGLKAGKDFGLCVQPEFLRAKSSEADSLHPWAIVIGELDLRSGNMLANLYDDFDTEIFRMDLEAAEFLKYVHNCFNATKISFANEMWLLGRHLGIDANSIMKIAAKTAEGFWNPDYGTVGGQPYGGDCLPKDCNGLLRFAQRVGISLPLLSAVVSVNTQMEDLARDGLIPSADPISPMWQPSPNLRKIVLKKVAEWEQANSARISSYTSP